MIQFSQLISPFARVTIVGALCVLVPLSPARAATTVSLADSILSALPPIATIVKSLFAPNTDATKTQKVDKAATQMESNATSALKNIGTYAQREQILSKVVAASGKASVSITTLDYLFSNQKLSDATITLLGTQEWQNVKIALNSIAQAAPDPTVFGNDSEQINAINDMRDANDVIKQQLDLQFYQVNRSTEMVAAMRANISELAKRFNALRKAVSIELDLVAKNLAEVANSNKSATDKQAATRVLLNAPFKDVKKFQPAVSASEALADPAGASKYVIPKVHST